MEKRFLNKKEIAEYLGLKEGTVSVWVCHRRIPFVRVGRLVKFDLRKIDAWIAENSVEVMN